MIICVTQYCTACPYIMEGKNVRIKEHKTWNINKRVNCQSYNAIYIIEYDKQKCIERYIGETCRILNFCLVEHRGYINRQVESEATGSQPGETLTLQS